MRNSNELNKIEANYKETWETRDIVLKELGITYKEYLESSHWKNIKKKASRRKRYVKCEKCESKNNINLHHKHYRFLFHKHELHSIIALCKTCHEQVHSISKETKKSVRQSTIDFLKC
jgi:Zn finger protein HypA/HybF involved in hydrogenase expression